MDSIPSPSELRALLDYNPQTGALTWRTRKGDGRETSRWNSRYAGREAGGINAIGYRNISIFGRSYSAHRLIWAIAYGEWPEDEVDHINNVRHDNRIANLRQATTSQNAMNRLRRSDNKAGYKGVRFYKRTGRWMASIRVNGKQQHLGYFDTAKQAHIAYKEAARKHHGEFSRE